MNANEYKLSVANRASVKTFDVKLPSGCVWKLKEPPVQKFILSGRLPASIVAKMSSVADGSLASEDIAKQLSPADMIQTLQFGRDLLLHCAVEPRISLEPKDDNEIAPEDIDPEDFQFLFNWVMSGGKSGESLSTFRPE